jgi:immune inhibitor A
VRRTTAGLLGLALASGVGVSFASTPAVAAPLATAGSQVGEVAGSDELPNAAEDKRRALRTEAISQILNGEATPQTINGSKVVKLKGAKDSTPAPAKAGQPAAKATPKTDRYVELAREKTDKIFVILAEFGDTRHPNYPDKDTSAATAGPVTFNGPLHNQIPQPDRAVNNKTIWQPDYNADHYRQLYFGQGAGVESLKTYYEAQSSGRYSVDGEVTDWVKVQYNQARYGRSNGYPCAGNVCSNTWNLIQDAINQWVANRHAASISDDAIKAELASYDQWDRNDFDNDGNFNEPDGYLDHFQIVHAGGDQADVDPVYGEDAIWSHRWKAFQGTGEGPTGNKDGGVQIGTTGLWVADYTIQPENGGLSVFAHEYGHDLGLPDDYDTATGGASPNEWWTLMAQSRLSAAGEPVGTRPGDLGAWQKLQLGWLDYEVAVKGTNTAINLGPEEYNSPKAQAVVMPLPKKGVTIQNPAPPEGTKSWWSGTGDDYEATMSRTVSVPTGATLNLSAAYDIEDCDADPCDYAYVEVDDGSGWKAVAGSITTPAEGNGIDGSTDGKFVPATFDLAAYGGKTVGLRVRYVTDGAQQGNPADKNINGIFVDAISITAGGQTVFSDGAESGANGWTLDKFAAVGTDPVTTYYDNYYIAGHRSYVSYDRYLKTGPYNYGFSNPNWGEHFALQEGLLISYWDLSQPDNNVSEHPGEGRNLYIDAHPKTLYRIDGQPWRTRIQLYDAPFSLRKADSFTLHVNDKPSYIRGEAAAPLFDDTKNYFDPELPDHGVKLPGVGVKIRVLSEDGTSMKIRVY